MRWKTGLTLGLAFAAAVLLVGVGGTAGSASETRPWRPLPDPPLSPRENPVGFWAGEEVVLLGGSDAPPCPPTATCDPPTTSAARRRRGLRSRCLHLADDPGRTTHVTAGTDLFVFQGSDWSEPDGALLSRAWLWSPRS